MPDAQAQAALMAAFAAAGGNSYRLQRMGLSAGTATKLIRGEPVQLRLEQWEAIRAWIAERTVTPVGEPGTDPARPPSRA